MGTSWVSLRRACGHFSWTAAHTGGGFSLGEELPRCCQARPISSPASHARAPGASTRSASAGPVRPARPSLQHGRRPLTAVCTSLVTHLGASFHEICVSSVPCVCPVRLSPVCLSPVCLSPVPVSLRAVSERGSPLFFIWGLALGLHTLQAKPSGAELETKRSPATESCSLCGRGGRGVRGCPDRRGVAPAGFSTALQCQAQGTRFSAMGHRAHSE